MTTTDKKPAAGEPYQTPSLTVYGTVRDLTQGNQSMGMNDMVGGPQKTG